MREGRRERALCMIAVGTTSARPVVPDRFSTQSSFTLRITRPRRPHSTLYRSIPLVEPPWAGLLPLRKVSGSTPDWNLAIAALRNAGRRWTTQGSLSSSSNAREGASGETINPLSRSR